MTIWIFGNSKTKLRLKPTSKKWFPRGLKNHTDFLLIFFRVCFWSVW